MALVVHFCLCGHMEAVSCHGKGTIVFGTSWSRLYMALPTEDLSFSTHRSQDLRKHSVNTARPLYPCISSLALANCRLNIFRKQLCLN